MAGGGEHAVDPWLAALERRAIVICLIAAAAAFALSGAEWRVAAGVLGGGLLIALSYRAIAGAVDALVGVAGASGAPVGTYRRRSLAWTVAKLALRYALLAVLAYVMIARLRLHPLGVLVGASSVVAAASVEAFRVLLKK